MTYTSGGLIEATDYNGFVSTTSGANVNDIWATGSTNKGYGETALSTVSAAATVTASQWATLNSKISAIASHQGTTITSRTDPVAGDTIAILTALNTDLTNVTNNRGNAAANGTQYVTWSGTSYQATGWSTSLTFTHTVTFPSADAARYFFNAGGRIKVEFSKTSTGNVGDPEWNDLADTLAGDVYITGGFATQTIAGTAYTGVTKVGGTGTPSTLATTAGWYNLTTTDTIVYKQFADTGPYTGNYIQIQAKTAGTGTQLVLTTTWINAEGDLTSGGTATDSPLSTFGTGPATVVTYYPPSSTYLPSASWGTPTVAASISGS